MSLCAPLIKAHQGPLYGSSRLENKGKLERFTDLQFLGGSRREGEGFTRISESNRRRVAAWGQKNDLLVHRWMAMQGYLGVLAKRGVLSFKPYWCMVCHKVHY